MTDSENKNPPKSDLEKLSRLYRTGNLANVESFCGVLLAAYPDSPLVYYVLGVALEGQGKLEDSLVAYRTTTQKDPNHVDAYHNTAILLSRLGRFEEAREKYNKIIELTAEDADAHNNLGVVLQNLNQHSLAVTHLQKAVDLQSGNASAFFNYANSLKELGENDKALLNYDQSLRINPSFSISYNNRGSLLESMSRYEDAQRSYTSAIKLDPKYVAAYSNRGGVEKKLGNYVQAASDLGKALELDPWKPEDSSEVSNFKFRLHVSLGDIQMYLGQYQKALKLYDSARAIEPDNKDVLAFKGNALAALGKLSEGLQLRQESFGFICFDVSKGVSLVRG